MRVLSLLISIAAAVSALAVRQTDVAKDLETLVSSPSSVNVEVRARWSDYNAPLPSVVVRVQNDKDVAKIVGSASTKLPVQRIFSANSTKRSNTVRKLGYRSLRRMAASGGERLSA